MKDHAYWAYIKNFVLIFIPLLLLSSILASAFWFHENKSQLKLKRHGKALLFKWMPWGGFAIVLMAAVPIGFAVVSVQRKRAAKERLYRERLQAVLEMAGGVCHELNPPMQAISGYCELLEMESQGGPPHSEKIAKIKTHIDRLSGITKKLTRITKYETMDYVDGKIVDIEKSARSYGDDEDEDKR